jgi:lipoprotein-anchoring transpeptidase ErfK/SrfK
MRRAVLVGLAAALLAAPAAHAAAGDRELSDERTESRWANVNDAQPIRSAPDPGAERVARLRYQTEDGLPEVYLALRARTVGEQEWVQVRVPGRPNARKGWVRREALGPLHVVTTRFVVTRRKLRATLYEGGQRIWRSRIGVGAPGTPTPRGRFYIRQRLRNLGGNPLYGPWAFGTSAYSVLSDWPGGGVVGIHGTNQPGLLPGRVSHGCIRVPNAKIARLARLMPIGTPVRIV